MPMPITQTDVAARVHAYLRANLQTTQWIRDYDRVYHDFGPSSGRSAAERLAEFADVARQHGWGMNRKGQCVTIRASLRTTAGTVPAERILAAADDIRTELRPMEKPCDVALLTARIAVIQQELGRLHQSADTNCFVTKVVLMFGTGQSPAFDGRVARKLDIRTVRMTAAELSGWLIRLGEQARESSDACGSPLAQLVTNAVRAKLPTLSIREVPPGRAVDMLLFAA